MVLVVFLFFAGTLFLLYSGVVDKDTVLSWSRTLVEPSVKAQVEESKRESFVLDPQHFFTRVGEHVEGFQQLANCAKTKTLAVEQGKTTAIYRWKDKDGQIHFSDQEPGQLLNSEQMVVHFPDRKSYFTLELVTDNGRQPPFARDRISAEVRQIYEILAKDLSLDHLRQVVLKVRIIDTQEAFQAYRQRIAPELKTDSGFYSSQHNEAVVFKGEHAERMYAVIRHEVTHVIVAGLYGYTPTWFNEGLAEYFEYMDIQGQMRKVSPVFSHLALLRAGINQGTLMDLKQYMQLNPRQWYGQELNEKYALAWSLVYFLFSDDQGQTMLRAIMGQMANNYCWQFSSIDYLEQTYPGGFNTFAADWQAWLTKKPRAHHY